MHEAAQLAAPNLSMWVTFALIIGTLGLYAVERFPVEVTSVGVLGVFMVYFHFQPIAIAGGGNVMSAERLVAGFANPALVTMDGMTWTNGGPAGAPAQAAIIAGSVEGNRQGSNLGLCSPAMPRFP